MKPQKTQRMMKLFSAKLGLALALIFGLSAYFLNWSATQAAQEKLTASAGEVTAQAAETNAINEQNRRARLEQRLEALKGKAKGKRLVRVIVDLRGGFKPLAEVTDKQTRQAQRGLIDRAQDSLLNKLALSDRSTVKKFRTIPSVVIEAEEFNLEQLLQLEEVESVIEDVPVAPSLTESTALIGAPAAWNQGFTGAGQTVAILDTGVDNDHSFLAGKVVSEACFSTTSYADGSTSVCPGGVHASTAAGSADNVASTISSFDHGTHVAGIAAGNGDNFSGVAKDAKIIAIQVFSRFNNQSACGARPAPCLLSYPSDQIEGLERVLDLSDNFDIAAVNLSLGDGNFTSTCNAEYPSYFTLVTSLKGKGIATVISAGNSGDKHGLSFPACISTAISVGAVGDGSGGAAQDVVVSYSQSASFLQLLAPGRSINSSVPGNLFANKGGTSMAAPHVTGVFAVLKSKVPNAGITDLLAILKQTGVPITDAANGITKRRINLGEAIDGLCVPTDYKLSSAIRGFEWPGGTGAFQVTAPTGSCLWRASSNAFWLNVQDQTLHTGNGTVNYAVQPNYGGDSRTGRITIGGRIHIVVQNSLY